MTPIPPFGSSAQLQNILELVVILLLFTTFNAKDTGSPVKLEIKSFWKHCNFLLHGN